MAIQGNENHNPRRRVRIEGLSHLLHPPLLDEVGLASGLRSYLEEFTATGQRIRRAGVRSLAR